MEKDGITVIEIWDSSDEEEIEERNRRGSSKVAAKGKFKTNTKNREFDDDCYILECDPLGSFKKLSINDKEEDDNDTFVIGERGPVACRDFPHSRHLCGKFPFKTTLHFIYCKQCYCYVCDTIAPCKFWLDGEQKHCDATTDDSKWKVLRQARKPISSST